jgi:NifU-like protein involved in Fe-S cluster formation
MEYSSEVLRRFDAPPRAGELPHGTPGLLTGAAEDRTQHVWVRFQLQVLDGAVRAARFAAFGCPHTVAAASLVAERLEGRPVGDATRVDVHALQTELGVPVEKLGKLLRIEDALAACRRALDRDVTKDDRP